VCVDKLTTYAPFFDFPLNKKFEGEIYMNEDDSTKERLDSLECEVRKTKRYQGNQAHKEETYSQLEEALPQGMLADLQQFAKLWEDLAHYHSRYCYNRGVDDGAMFSRILNRNRGDVARNVSTQTQIISEGAHFSTSRETNFWEFIKACMQERVQQIGTEELDEIKYKELDKEIMLLAHRLGEALPKDKRGLVDEYHNSMAAEEAAGEDIFYCQGFTDGALPALAYP